MPVELKLFTIEEAAKLLKKEFASLSAYCSKHKIGDKWGHARMLRESDLDRLRGIKMGRPKKNSAIST